MHNLRAADVLSKDASNRRPIMVAALALFSLLATMLLNSCGSSTSILNSWKDPSAGPIDFKKVLVIFITNNQSSKRAAEDALVHEIKKAQAVAAYTLLTEEDTKDVEKAKVRLKDQGFDGAITMRIVGSSQQTTYVPGSYPAPYGSFYGYYGYAYPGVYDPGYMRTDQLVRVESNVYSLTDDKLIWAATSSTMNPTSAPDLAVDVARECAYELENQGLLKK
jgi:hypothetical protein